MQCPWPVGGTEWLGGDTWPGGWNVPSPRVRGQLVCAGARCGSGCWGGCGYLQVGLSPTRAGVTVMDGLSVALKACGGRGWHGTWSLDSLSWDAEGRRCSLGPEDLFGLWGGETGTGQGDIPRGPQRPLMP